MAYNDHELIPLHDWTTETADGFTLNDPVSGDPMNPNAPPSFLLENRRLRDGRDYIEYLLSDVVVGVLYTPDERHAADLGPASGDASFEDMVHNPLYNVQAVGHTLDGVVVESVEKRVALSQAGSPYLERITSATAPAKIATFCMGLEVDWEGQPAGRTERALQAIADMAEVQVYDEADQEGLGLAALKVITRNARQWYRVLSAGERLQQISTSLQNRGQTLENALIVAPIADADYTRKFQAAGIGRVIEQAVDPDSYNDDMRWETVAMQRGAIVLD